jgi:tRNA modification GTPase
VTDAARETVIACLTPPGAGAVATLAAHGPDAWAVCRDLFTPQKGALPEHPETVPAGRTYLGLLGDALRDQAVLSVRRTSPVPWVEMHCHGGRQMPEALLESFRRRGLRVLTWREWYERAESSPLRAEAARQLAMAPTVRTASILLDQYHGALEKALAEVRRQLRAGDAASAGQTLANLLRYADVGRHLTRPWRVAVAGAPNVGKSSLVNALSGYRRCIVSETAGTTRDVVTTGIALDGWPVELADTAGLRDSPGLLEQEGMRLARVAASSADLCLWVADASASPVWPERQGAPVLTAINKTDLPPAWDLSERPEAVRVSALTGEGIAALGEALVARLVPHAPPAGVAVPFTEEVCRQIDSARRACEEGDASAALAALDSETD